MNDFKSPEIIFKYYLPDNQEEVWLHTHASDMYILLYAIDQRCRTIIKYDDTASEGMITLAEEIRETIRENIDLDKVS